MKNKILKTIIIFIIITLINTNIIYGNEDNTIEENLNINDENETAVNSTEIENQNEEQILENLEESGVTNDIIGQQSIEDGTYNIIALMNKNLLMSVKNGSIQSGEKLEFVESNKSDYQKFIIEYAGDGFYKIKSKKSNKVLTVESENPSLGSEVTQEEDENLDTQKWIIKENPGNVYSIISKCNNLYVYSIQSSTEPTLRLFRQTQLNNLKFIFVKLDITKDIAYVKDGVYQIELSNGKVLDVSGAKTTNGANVHIWENNNSLNQKFHIKRIGSTNYYSITATHSSKALDVSGSKETPGTNVQQYQSNNSNGQRWLFQKAENGYYYIVSKCNGLYLDVKDAKIEKNGTNVQMNYNNLNVQKFKLKEVRTISNNTYEIETKLSSNKVINIADASEKNKAKANIYTPQNANHQRFIISQISPCIYKIIAKHSNKALTLNESNEEVYQKTYTGALNQQWEIIEIGNGYYGIRNRKNGKYIGVQNAKAKNGKLIKAVYNHTKTDARQFKFVTGYRKFYEEGTYGKSGLKIKGDKRGTKLKYYKIGRGSKSFFATFSIHGFEDSYSKDGKELTYIAEEFKKYLINNISEKIVNKYTIYIFPCLNPDGQNYGYTNNGPGRTTLYSNAPTHKGIDMNRNWSVDYIKLKDSRNYNGTKPFQAYEAKYLRNFILDHEGKSNILIDTHGWLEETMGNKSLGKYYANQFGFSKHIDAYGRGYLINWARTLRKGKSVLVELPEVTSHKQVVNRNYAQKWIDATMKLLKEN